MRCLRVRLRRIVPEILACGVHRCEQPCHDGPCPPCRRKGVFRCLCGKIEEERDCCDSEFRCENPCKRLLDCGKHSCDRGCHSSECGDCPRLGRRTCPCGKVEHKGIGCDALAPTCGSTCWKMLPCGLHRCPERCHRRACIDICRTVVTKSCRCGSLRKEVPYNQELVCDRKCQRPRNCGRHACKRRCCGGDCSACPEVCGRKLRCNNHKCPSPCHRYPVVLRRNRSHPGVANHVCCLVYASMLQAARCHGPLPAPNPEFTLKPKTKRKRDFLQSGDSPGTPCPPCQEIVL